MLSNCKGASISRCGTIVVWDLDFMVAIASASIYVSTGYTSPVVLDLVPKIFDFFFLHKIKGSLNLFLST